MAAPSYAWTLRGHQIVCEAAIFLIQDADLREFLQGKGLVMSHLCNLPDTQWRDVDADRAFFGNMSHYFAADLVNSNPEKIGSDYPSVVRQFLNLHSEYDQKKVYKTLGSNWWRAQQFFQRAISLKSRIEKATPPHQSAEFQKRDLPYNQAIFDFIVNIGIMGHFVGDNSQPFHVTHDYDGYDVGHGGIHLYYEDEAVNALPVDLFEEVVKEGQRFHNESENQKWIKSGTVVERMRKLGQISLSERDAILKWDPVLESSQVKGEGATQTRIPAKRKDAKFAAPGAKNLIVKEMARGAALLAEFWQEAYQEIGRPSLKAYKSYQFPTVVDFIDLNYLE